ncbi:aminoglycoside 6'-N-acetyltransferase [Enterococcus sp. LJL98]
MIRRAEKEDALHLAILAHELWPSQSIEAFQTEFSEMLLKKDIAFFLRFEEEQAVAFAQCQLRYEYVEGTKSSPVGYLEGIYVKEAYRKQGIATQLLGNCQAWAKEQGCQEFASDCELENTASLHFHLATGFIEANRIICFTKKL